MARIPPATRLPEKRLIVLASVNAQGPMVEAVRRRRVEAIMVTFTMIVGNGKLGEPGGGPRAVREWDKKWVPVLVDVLDTWPQYRYLDSGVFTLMRQRALHRMPLNAIQGVSKRTEAMAPTLHIDELQAHFDAYKQFVTHSKDAWDFIIEIDVDRMTIIDNTGKQVPGLTATTMCRESLRKAVGDKLLPVWHFDSDPPPHRLFDRLIEEYPYVAIGGGLEANSDTARQLCARAHKAGVLIHHLGTSKPEVMANALFDTCDSTTWLAALRFGRFFGVTMSDQQNITQREQTKARALQQEVREMGYDPAALLHRGAQSVEKMEIAIALAQKRQADLQLKQTPYRYEHQMFEE